MKTRIIKYFIIIFIWIAMYIVSSCNPNTDLKKSSFIFNKNTGILYCYNTSNIVIERFEFSFENHIDTLLSIEGSFPFKKGDSLDIGKLFYKNFNLHIDSLLKNSDKFCILLLPPSGMFLGSGVVDIDTIKSDIDIKWYH